MAEHHHHHHGGQRSVADTVSPPQPEHHGHGDHGGHQAHVAEFRWLFWAMLVLAVPTVAASAMFASILGYTIPDLPGIQAVSPVLGTVIYIWGGRPFLVGAVSEIRSRTPGMMLLIGLAITVAFLASWGSTLGILGHELDFWWELALLVVIMLLGHWLEMRSLAQTTSALDSLVALLPDQFERVEGDESMVTGESRTVPRAVGDHVVASTVATDSGLRVRVTAVGGTQPSPESSAW
jgi:P-type Cu2+ transporter